MRITHRIICRRDAVRRDGTAALAVQVFLNGARKVMPLQVWVRPEDFDDIRQQVRIDGEVGKKINLLLDTARQKAEGIRLDAMLHGRTLTPESFAEAFTGEPNRDDFLKFFEKEIKACTDREANTLKSYRTSLKVLRTFRSPLYFADLTLEFVEAYERWLVGKKLATNTRFKYHRELKHFINLSIRRGRRMRNPYADFKLKQARTMRTWLTLDELGKLIDLYRSVRHLDDTCREVLRYFLFATCCGGLRYSDLADLTDDSIQGDTLVFTPRKTKSSLRAIAMPISKLAADLLRDGVQDFGKRRGPLREWKAGQVFRVVSDMESNTFLKVAAEKVGIKKNLSMHVARHTFATTFLRLGGKVEVLQSLLGHAKLETTMVYVHIAHEQKVVGMAAFDEIFRL